MPNILRNVLDMLRNFFLVGSNSEDAWIDNTNEMTPRERQVRRVGTILQIGALVNLVVALVLMVLLATGSLSSEAGKSLLLNGYAEQTTGMAALVGTVAILANFSLLFLIAVGAQAQEFWVLLLGVLLVVANVAALIALQFWAALLVLLPLGYAAFESFRDLQAYHANPVMYKELRGRMRGVRSFAIITIFLTLMGSFTVLLYLLNLPLYNTSNTINTGELGRQLFYGVVGVELLLIVFIVPALTAGAITGERERKTYDLLQTTLLSAPSFIVGKMESALGYMVLLLLSAIPLQSIAFLFGGISGTEIGLAFALLLVTALLLGALGMLFSSLTDRTLTATIRVYVVALFLFIAPFVISQVFLEANFEGAVTARGVNPSEPQSEAAFVYMDMIAVSVSPVTSAIHSQQMLLDQQSIFLAEVTLPTAGNTIPVVAPWLITTILYLGLTAILLRAAVWRMRIG